MIKGQEIRMTPYEIADGIKTWCVWTGFTAGWCGQCQCSINTFARCAGFFCPRCDHFNVQSWSNSCIPHLKPDFGPTRTTIHKGGQLARKFFRRNHKYTVGQKVWANRCHYPNRGTKVEEGRIVEPGSDLWPWLTSYQVQFESDGRILRCDQQEICPRTPTTKFIRQLLYAEKDWMHHISEISTSEIRQSPFINGKMSRIAPRKRLSCIVGTFCS